MGRRAEEQYFATALLEEWHRVLHITFVMLLLR